MKLLACRRQPTGGVVLVNGAPLEDASYKRSSGFVAQTTVCLDTLTVRETIVATALLRLDRSVPVAQKLARAEEVIRTIGLLKVADSRIGNDVAGGISGGERRRLSIGVEVVHRPRLLLLGALHERSCLRDSTLPAQRLTQPARRCAISNAQMSLRRAWTRRARRPSARRCAACRARTAPRRCAPSTSRARRCWRSLTSCSSWRRDAPPTLAPWACGWTAATVAMECSPTSPHWDTTARR